MRGGAPKVFDRFPASGTVPRIWDVSDSATGVNGGTGACMDDGGKPQDGGRSEDSPELACLGAIRAGRVAFFAALVERAEADAPAKRRDSDGRLTRDFLGLIRSEASAQVAEFFFLAAELGLHEEGLFRRFLIAHNAAMDSYLAEPGRTQTLGLSRQRVEAARFSEEQIGFIELVSPAGALYLDQSSIGRLLAEVMAPESCRKVVIALADAGLLTRHTVGHVLISSDGTLESLYRRYLGTIVTSVKESA